MLFTKNDYYDQIKDDGMQGSCNMHGRILETQTKVWLEYLREKGRLEDLRVSEKMVLKSILRQRDNEHRINSS